MSTTKPRLLWPVRAAQTASATARDDLAGVRLLAVWGSPVGHVAALGISGDLSERTKVAMGRILRLVGDAAAQVGRASPVVGAVVVPAHPDGIEDTLRRWAADQDWHRGDFLVWTDPFVASSDEFLDGDPVVFRSLVRELIGPLDPLAESVPRLEGTRSPSVILENARYAAGAAGARELLAILQHARPEDWGSTVDAWTSGVIDAARRASAEAVTTSEASVHDEADEEQA